MRLQDESIVSLRSKMIQSYVPDLLKILDDVKNNCKGGDEHMEYRTSLIRDVFAYAIVGFLDAMNCCVFGGFVAAHISGKKWNDIDILVPDSAYSVYRDFNCIIKIIIKHIRFCFGLPATSINMKKMGVTKHYAKSISFNFTLDSDIKFDIDIDMVQESAELSDFIPATMGGCLLIKDRVVSMRRILLAELLIGHWSCVDVKQALKKGEDIALCLNLEGYNEEYRDAYSLYFWRRVKKIQRAGYIVEEFVGDPPTRLDFTD